MSKFTDRLAARLAGIVTGRPGWVLLAALVVMLALTSGARHLEFTNNYRVFFSEENPELIAFEEFQATYTKNDNIMFVVRPDDGHVFTPETLAAIEEITERAWQIPYALRVDSITNFQHSWADGDELTVEDLVRDPRALPASEIDRREAIALSEPILAGNLISLDGDTTGINVTLQYPEQGIHEVPEAVAVAREIADDIRASYPGTTIALTGVSMLNNAFSESGEKDIATLVPLMYAVLLLVMIVTLRSFAGTFATLLVIIFSAASAMGFAGYVGIKLTPISVTAPTIIMTLAIADSIHILIAMLAAMRRGMSKREAIFDSLRLNLVPVSITSLTTIVGFLSLNFSDAPPFWHLGNISAFGILVAWIYSLTVLPAAIMFCPMRVKQSASRTNGVLARLGDRVVRHRRFVLPAAAAVSLTLIAFVPSIELNDQWVKYFNHRVEFRNDADFATEHLSGVYLLEMSVEADGPGGINEPAYLERLDAFTEWLRSRPELLHVRSYTDVMRRLNRNMHGDDPAWYRIPEERELAAQYLLLYELSLPYGLDLNDRVSVDRDATRLSATVDNLSTREVRAFITEMEGWLETHAPEHMHADATGATVMFSYISQRNIESMLTGNVIAVLLIGLIMMLTLRSFGLGLLSLIPNAVPILITFGIWSILVGKIGMAAATVSVTSLGIVVDDTVHFLAKYLRARREEGLDRGDAVRYAFDTVGRAMVATTIILVLGFSVLAFSTFRINYELGMMTALTILVALIVDFLLLPGLLLIGYRERKEELTDEEPSLVSA